MEVKEGTPIVPIIDAHVKLFCNSNPNSPEIRNSSNKLIQLLKVRPMSYLIIIIITMGSLFLKECSNSLR